MDVSEYRFDKDEIENLHRFRDEQEDFRLKQRFVALLMLAEGLEPKKVASILGKSEKTLGNWFQQYLAKGIESLNSFQYKPKKSFLDEEQNKELAAWVRETNPSNLKQVRKYVKDKFKVAYSIEGVRKILVKNGLKLLKPKVIPGNSPDEEEQKKKFKSITK